MMHEALLWRQSDHPTLDVDGGDLHHHAQVSVSVVPPLVDVPGVLEGLGLGAHLCHHGEGDLIDVTVRVVVVDVDGESSADISVETGGQFNTVTKNIAMSNVYLKISL